MKMPLLLPVLLLALLGQAYAQEAVPVVVAALPTTVSDPLENFRETTVPIGSPADELKALRTEYLRLQTAKQQHLDRQGWITLIVGFLIAGIKFTISMLTRYSEFAGRYRDKIPGVMLMLGVVLTLLLKTAGGTDWMTAVMFGMAGPVAVFAHEFKKMFQKKEDNDDVEIHPIPPIPPTPTPT